LESESIKMAATKSKSFEASLVEYLVQEYFEGDIKRFSEQVGYSKQQIGFWLRGEKKPQKATLRWMLSSTIAPEFKVACEFFPIYFSSKDQIRGQLREALGDQANKPGVYAFYDSMCAVIYLGKASTGFLEEMYQQLRRGLGISFPRAVATAPKERWQAVRYVSAYEVPHVEHLDYPKHVEALVLRLSKPIGNKSLGTLKMSAPPNES
jgi:transcriptional regulator with XRE-family HTH domain